MPIPGARHYRGFRAMCCDERAHARSVFDGLEAEDARRIDIDRFARVLPRSRCDHQLVVGDGCTIFGDHAAAPVLDGNHFGALADLDIPLSLKKFGRVDNEIVKPAHFAGYEVREPAGTVGNGIALFKNDDLERTVDSPGTGSCAHSGCNTADDNQAQVRPL
jgi:hypothetical protein